MQYFTSSPPAACKKCAIVRLVFHELGYCETQDCGQLTICKTVTINLFVSSLYHFSNTPTSFPKPVGRTAKMSSRKQISTHCKHSICSTFRES